MFFLGKIPQSVEKLLDRLQTLSERLMEGFSGESVSHTFSNESQILDLFATEQLGCIRSGVVTIVSKGV